MQKIADLRYSSAVLQWDQETYMPVKGAAMRGRQLATLAELAHEQFTSPQMGSMLRSLKERRTLSAAEMRNVELSLQDYDKNCKLPASYVRRLSEATNLAFHAWIDARRKNTFSIFQQSLQHLIDLKKQEAEYLGYVHHPYDALLDEFDKGQTVAKLDNIFNSLRPRITEILEAVASRPQVEDGFLRGNFNKDAQWALGIEVLGLMGYDFEAGRQDISEHPFTTNFSSQDVRVTTRIDEKDFSNMLWSCIHEGGHALYEQGLPAGEYGLPLGEYCSLSIHESQSRLWENCIGRSNSFWEKYVYLLEKYFPEQFKNISTREFYKAINKVSPSFIRTEADELTYHFHVIIRYELEKMLIGGSLEPRDIPAAWNELYLKYLGIIVPDDRRGCLQDVHWSHGSFGYFSTYSIGSLYAAQFYAAIYGNSGSIIMPSNDLDIGKAAGWLTQHIYPHGRYYNSEELCALATGEKLNPDYFVSYATRKYKEIYGI
ncbi:MAG: carboxypeptidase M32 [Ferruginibacter sp.]